MNRPCESYTTEHLWAALLANTVTEDEDNLVECQVVEAHHRFSGLVERIAELEARVVTLVRDLARSEVSASKRLGNWERAEKRAGEAGAKVIAIDRVLQEMGEKVIDEANRREKAEAERDAALDALGDYGWHVPGSACPATATFDKGECNCGWDKTRKKVLPAREEKP